MPEPSPARPEEPAAVPRVILCPYCGELSRDSARCESCKGHFDPLSRQASQNSMGPWFIRDPASPFRPGCSFEVLRGRVRRGKVGLNTVVRGPTTNQFWSPARRAPGLANLLGVCHNCGWQVGADDVACLSCGATFAYHVDRQYLGLTEVRLLPGQAPPEAIAAASAHERTAPGPVGRADSRVNYQEVVPVRGPETMSEPRSRSGVPAWVWVLAVISVAGAGFAAAWVMNVFPWLPSPVLSRPAGAEGAQPPGPELPANGATKVGEDSANDVVPAPESAPGASEPEAPNPSENPVQPGPQPTPQDPPAADERVGEALGQLYLGTDAALRHAAALCEGLAEGRFIEDASRRLLAQIPLRRLP
jgi:hypothetical protein